MPDKPRDVLIVGGGLAGLASAILFAREGWEVTLIEKEHYPFHKVCGEYLSNESLEFLEDLGLNPAEMDLPQINKLRVSDPRGFSIKEDLHLGGFGVSRYVLDDKLAQLARLAGAEIIEGTEVMSWEYQESENLFKVKSGAGEYSAKLLLASYGKRTKIDRWLKRGFMFKKEPYIAVKYHIRFPIDPSEIVLHNFKNGYCGMSAIEEGKVCLCYLAHADDVKKEGGIPELEKNILQKNPHLKKIWQEAEFLFEKPLVISRFSFKPKKQIIEHAVFAGDAAGLIPPLCGNGMSMALHGAKLFFYWYHQLLLGTCSLQEAELGYNRDWNSQFVMRLKVGRTLQYFFGSEWITVFFIRSLSPFKWLKSLLIKATHGKRF